ncbi:sulfurtransferase [Corynebacterium choanae]|nr:sulfurtransferase [Corynebacterium choanae]
MQQNILCSVHDLAKQLGYVEGSGGDTATGKVVVLCASMGNPAKHQAMIPGALLCDIDDDFSRHDGGVHTAPSVTQLRRLFAARGVSPSTPVVIYDRHGMMVAPRVFWLARVAGYQQVQLLDGGLPAWLEAGLPTVTTFAHPVDEQTAQELFAAAEQELAARVDLLVDIDEVEQALSDDQVQVIDARSRGRFTGEDPEPRPGMESGHMPGSWNIAFQTVFPQGRFVGIPATLALLEGAGDIDDRKIFSCGSGVTACVVAVAALVAGARNVTVFDGSWSQWATEGKPIATGDDGTLSLS